MSGSSGLSNQICDLSFTCVPCLASKDIRNPSRLAGKLARWGPEINGYHAARTKSMIFVAPTLRRLQGDFDRL